MTLSESLPATCPCSGAISFAGHFFAARDASRLTGVEPTRPPSHRLVGDANFFSRSRDALELDWSNHAYLVPASFSGSLSVVPTIYGCELTLTGSNPVATATILRTTMRSLLQQIVLHVERDWKLFEASCASAATCNARSMRTTASLSYSDVRARLADDGALDHAPSAIGTDRE